MDVLTLEQVLKSYNILITFLFLFIVLVIVLFLINPNGFNKLFGTEIFITGPILFLLSFLIKDFIAFKNDPSKSWMGKLSWSTKNWFPYAVIALLIAIGIGGFFAILEVGGIFSSTPPENNIAMLINFILIIIFVLVGYFIYSRSKETDQPTFQQLPRNIQQLFELRTRYTVMFVCFILFITILYYI